jgi:hypothetical protein
MKNAQPKYKMTEDEFRIARWLLLGAKKWLCECGHTQDRETDCMCCSEATTYGILANAIADGEHRKK